MRLDRLNVINDYAQNLSVVSVDGLNYLFQIGICCGIMLSITTPTGGVSKMI